ncbi:MAG TPA: hypothetical protein VGM63_20520 [Mucilaginibacter sp.]|jgi:hypothetical protein
MNKEKVLKSLELMESYANMIQMECTRLRLEMSKPAQKKKTKGLSETEKVRLVAGRNARIITVK